MLQGRFNLQIVHPLSEEEKMRFGRFSSVRRHCMQELYHIVEGVSEEEVRERVDYNAAILLHFSGDARNEGSFIVQDDESPRA